MSLAYRPLPVPRLGMDAPLLTHLEQTQDQLRRVFAEIPSFTITSAAAGDTLRFDGTDWVNTNLFQVTATEARISHATNAALDFYIGGTRRAGLSVTASDVLRFTDSAGTVKLQFQLGGTAGEIIPPSTSLAFRNNADSATNLLISDAGVVTGRAGLLIATDNANDLGAAGATRPRTGYFGTSVESPTFTRASTGTLTVSSPGASGIIRFSTNGSNRWDINASGHFIAVTDASFDIGQSGATRPRNLYVSGSIVSSSINAGTGSITLTAPTEITAGSGIRFRVTGASANAVADFTGGTLAGSVTIDQYGALNVALPSITANRVLGTFSATWNSAGVAFQGILMDVTNTASAAGARLVDLQVGSVSQAAWDVNGHFFVQSVKVVGTRVTGYSAITGTANRGTSYDTSTITLVQLAQRVKAIQEDLTAHGLIGA